MTTLTAVSAATLLTLNLGPLIALWITHKTGETGRVVRQRAMRTKG
jgi:hypothetical protein